MSASDILKKRLILMTGKGGVGKSTCAVALALAAQRSGKRVLLCETGARAAAWDLLQGVRPQHIPVEADRSKHPGLWVSLLDPQTALQDYLAEHLKVGTLAKLATQNRVLARLWRAMPSVNEMALLNAVYQLERATDTFGRPQYDLIILDLPATGHALAMLSVPDGVLHMIKRGPLAQRARDVSQLLHDTVRTGTLIVTLPEELPCNESVHLAERLRETLRMEPSHVIINGVLPQVFDADEDALLSRLAKQVAEGPGKPLLQAVARNEGIRRLQRVRMAELRQRLQAEFLEVAYSARLGLGLVDDVASAILESLRVRAVVMESVLDAIGKRQVVLCAGPGGVGKTTSSAAIAVAAANAGKRVLVLTIDPAKRLADALGVGLDNEPRRIDDARLREEGIALGGELWAVMLDPQRTFDDLIARLAPTPEASRRILNNVVYRQISRSMAGTLEYTAVEKLYDLRDRFEFDLIVVDTPPSKNVLDFLEAPGWLSRFLDERILKWFLLLDPKQASGGFRRGLLQRTGRLVSDVLAKVLGPDFVGEIVEFLLAIEVMTAELRWRADRISDLLRSPDTVFFVVATTGGHVLSEAAFLRSEIARMGIPFGGFILNRTHPASGVEDLQAAARAVRQAAGGDPAAERLAGKLMGVCQELDLQARHDFDAVNRLRQQTGWKGFLAMLPKQIDEINDLPSLLRLSQYLRA